MGPKDTKYDPYSGAADPEDYNQIPQTGYKGPASYEVSPLEYADPEDEAADPEDYDVRSYKTAASFKPSPSYKPEPSYNPGPNYNPAPSYKPGPGTQFN